MFKMMLKKNPSVSLYSQVILTGFKKMGGSFKKSFFKQQNWSWVVWSLSVKSDLLCFSDFEHTVKNI